MILHDCNPSPYAFVPLCQRGFRAYLDMKQGGKVRVSKYMVMKQLQGLPSRVLDGDTRCQYVRLCSCILEKYVGQGEEVRSIRAHKDSCLWSCCKSSERNTQTAEGHAMKLWLKRSRAIHLDSLHRKASIGIRAYLLLLRPDMARQLKCCQ